MQIFPAAGLPFLPHTTAAKKLRKLEEKEKEENSPPKARHSDEDAPAKVVIVNLQETKLDSRADICLRATIDEVLRSVCGKLDVTIEAARQPEADDVFIPRIVSRYGY